MPGSPQDASQFLSSGESSVFPPVTLNTWGLFDPFFPLEFQFHLIPNHPLRERRGERAVDMQVTKWVCTLNRISNQTHLFMCHLCGTHSVPGVMLTGIPRSPCPQSVCKRPCQQVTPCARGQHCGDVHLVFSAREHFAGKGHCLVYVCVTT